MKNDSKLIEVDPAILGVIYEATLPIYYKLNSLLEDVISNTIRFSETDKSLLLEFCSASSALKILFENYIDIFEKKPENEKIKLRYEEYATIMALSKTVELASRSILGGITIQEH